ncbi:choice-of-anchor Q domain-containing protein, partial [Salmonella enterica]|uniref:choice-of-anchor Q domain-containing protein n=1 Tax=Salmonella enterica TaxID=28901 RepID=UPI003D2BD9D6
MLGPLTNNEGTTETHLPQDGSPAIDAGNLICEALDQRGLPRPSGAACDIGAVEVQQPTPTPT